MALFRCRECGCVENTATSRFWETRDKLCSECDPKVGRWHGVFEKASADGMVEASDGFLISPQEAALHKSQAEFLGVIHGIKHMSAEGIAKYAFECGWNRGAAWSQKKSKVT